ncbi:sigma-70 family RNA polymerase sigma factor [Halomonas sabkhae]|uniref:sigma-70 family RNA polymerase sigma factor n=1 Tax=Halomonas sabkhae TaxID=626223 RepID=UPI0025B55EC6|nr:sigma-70 family RNA polymerase sigma factor [Halomonas sabkhae]MDN3525892.1 sigma-70 family RNA polymerase sigma factor [Halomonas sabkhae]
MHHASDPASDPAAGTSTGPDAMPGAITREQLEELLQGVADQDRQAFARLYEATAAKLYGAVLRILKHEQRTDDVVQEVYVTIWQKAEQFDALKASPITWMVTIARNRAIDELRRRPTARHEPADILDQTASDTPSARERLEGEEDAQRLYACLEELEGRRQDMVRLAYLEGWSRADLAEHFEQPVNTVKTWLHRALKQLKGCLAS